MPRKKKIENTIKKTHLPTRELFYATPIFYKDIENSAEINKHLIKNILQWKKRDEKGIIRSNSLGWHSAVDMGHRKEYNIITKELFKLQNEIYQAEGYHPDTHPILDNMWANVNYKYAHNKNHTHPGAQWSGVYYVQCPPDCGHIWFTDPCGERHMDLPIMADKMNRPSHYWREVHYQPVEGRLIMFPGWLVHEVAPNMTAVKGEKGWRISISFNFKQQWKPDKYQPPKGGHHGGGLISQDQL